MKAPKKSTQNEAAKRNKRMLKMHQTIYTPAKPYVEKQQKSTKLNENNP
jgi:hypothetical protein